MPLPRLWLMTDARADAQLLESVRALPQASGIVFRHYHLPPPERYARWRAVKAAAGGRHMLLLAGEPWLAARWHADGAHLGRAPINAAMRRFARRHGLILSAAAHDAAEIERANREQADLLFLSPVHATRSHPDAAVLGADRFTALCSAAHAPVIALGGMTLARFAALDNAYGWAAIDALTP